MKLLGSFPGASQKFLRYTEIIAGRKYLCELFQWSQEARQSDFKCHEGPRNGDLSGHLAIASLVQPQPQADQKALFNPFLSSF